MYMHCQWLTTKTDRVTTTIHPQLYIQIQNMYSTQLQELIPGQHMQDQIFTQVCCTFVWQCVQNTISFPLGHIIVTFTVYNNNNIMIYYVTSIHGITIGPYFDKHTKNWMCVMILMIHKDNRLVLLFSLTSPSPLNFVILIYCKATFLC